MFDADIIVVLGPTASGKTNFAVNLADRIDAEIISADSRQVYKNMDIGTGKDLSEYQLGDKLIPYHLINICEAGEKYNLSRFQNDFFKAYQQINQKNRKTILCGGTGLYIQSVLSDFWQVQVPINLALRNFLLNKSKSDLIDIIHKNNWVHNIDMSTQKRLIRGIEIGEFLNLNPDFTHNKQKNITYTILGLNPDLELRRQNISNRLKHRIEKEGLVQEVQNLIRLGIDTNTLKYYGLEYRFVTEYLLHEISFEKMCHDLEIAIHQFAKRQMTFFRSMEKKGFEINWITDKKAFFNNMKL